MKNAMEITITSESTREIIGSRTMLKNVDATCAELKFNPQYFHPLVNVLFNVSYSAKLPVEYKDLNILEDLRPLLRDAIGQQNADDCIAYTKNGVKVLSHTDWKVIFRVALMLTCKSTGFYASEYATDKFSLLHSDTVAIAYERLRKNKIQPVVILDGNRKIALNMILPVSAVTGKPSPREKPTKME